MDEPEREASPRTQGLALYIERAVARLRERREDPGSEGLIFVGSWNDAIPRLLILDPILKPTEVRIWSVMKTLADPGGPASMPDYETLAKRVNVASRATVAAGLLVLRMTRWISLCARVRDPSGRFAGNVYAMHDEPVTLADAMHLDPGYLGFLFEMTGHASPRVRTVAQAVLDTIRDSIQAGEDVTQAPGLHQRAVQAMGFFAGAAPEAAEADTDSLFAVSEVQVQKLNSGDQVQKMNPDHRVQNLNSDGSPVSKNELGSNFTKNQSVGNRVQKMNSALSSSSRSKTTTTTDQDQKNHPARTRARPKPIPGLHWPSMLTPDERLLVSMHLDSVDPGLAQDILDEAQGRMAEGSVRNPTSFINRLVVLARDGGFQFTSHGLRVRKAREARLAAEARVRQYETAPMPPPAHRENTLVQRVEAMRRKRSEVMP
ncbi:hypothetical protein B1C78_00620 [Thioalkalivibrio denitrificans]|uniref:Helix-turn-helix domain-containing protein n=1 Tax=Thioalkalivibrio denitrificans TaxID=108003 RepID=A0A1V3NUV1_9GAMM|nr:STY4528 family pathogenicity island replication protein [Thioalkalivibrio denitrificans]OOG28870.1 hypothetical protein B1C78_00620 [Thioalkalivibrio denitrificans]